jgi:hypothetical protein
MAMDLHHSKGHHMDTPTPSIGTALVRTLFVAAIAAVALAVVSDLPVIGSLINFPGLNWLIWIGMWAWLADRFVKLARPRLALSDNPALPAMGCAALLGLASGVLGQLVQLAVQSMFMYSAAANALNTGSAGSFVSEAGAGMSAIGSLVALFLYPAFGVFWGGAFGLLWGSRVRQLPLISPQA